jgi:hypothetical protein
LACQERKLEISSKNWLKIKRQNYQNTVALPSADAFGQLEDQIFYEDREETVEDHQLHVVNVA